MHTKSYLLFSLFVIAVFLEFGCRHQDNTMYIEQAEIFLSSEEYDKALEALNTLVANQPQNAEAHFLLGKTFLLKRSTEESVKHFTNAIAINKKYKEKIGTYFIELAEKYSKEGDHEKANYFHRMATKIILKWYLR